MSVATAKFKEELADEGVVAGVESEVTHFANEPFDPASISLATKVVALDSILRRIRNKTIKLAPDFQRNHVWNIERKSLLIESMMLRIPLPMFYVSEDKEGVWEVVDGLQRLTTIRDFVLGPKADGCGFQLKNLEFWADKFDGKTFQDIEADSRFSRVLNNILESELSFTVINPDTPEKVKRNIFKRINTGGMRLSSQEIRHALYHGQATDFLAEITQLPSYKKILAPAINDNRMVGRELILRYIAFELRGRQAFKGDMDEFLSDTLRWINGDISIDTREQFDEERVKKKFSKALRRCHEIFGSHVFRRSRGAERKTPINKALFELWMYMFARAREDLYQRILEDKDKFLEQYYELLDHDEEFANAIGRHGSDLVGVKNRYDKLILIFNEYNR